LIASSASSSVGKRAKLDNQEIIEKTSAKAVEIVAQMTIAADKDSDMLKRGEGPALHKVKILPEIAEQLNKPLMHQALIDKHVLTPLAQVLYSHPSLTLTLTQWLALLPGGSLPNTKVRETLLNILMHFPNLTREELTNSGIGKSIMALWKHPNESQPNKKIAKVLIDRYSLLLYVCVFIIMCGVYL
jgi:transcription factor SPN1